jgi:hypothetical protein
MINRLILVLIIVSSCRTIPKTTYQDKGLNFKVTEDFKIVETRTWKHNHATYIKIERRNKELYANFSVTWLPKKFDLDKEIQNFVDGLREAYKDDAQSKPTFSEFKSTKFGANDARQVNYVVTNDGPRIGSYTAFHCDDLTIIIGQHQTAESEAMTNSCRQLIEQTYKCIGQQPTR